MLRYAITDLSALVPGPGAGPEQARRRNWLGDLERWTAEGLDYIQLREKSLDAGELFRLAHQGMGFLLASAGGVDRPRPKLLLNGRADVAAAARADGVHLPSRPGELTPAGARTVFRTAGLPLCIVSRSCHTIPDVRSALTTGADLVLFGPVFGKSINGTEVSPPIGLPALTQACLAASPLPVFALGGITSGNRSSCEGAGAAGIAGIRLFATPAGITAPGPVRKW